MDDKVALVDNLIAAIDRNGKPKKVLKNDQARSIGYLVHLGEPSFSSRQTMSVLIKAMQMGMIEFVRSEPRIEWNETDFPVFIVPAKRVRQELLDLLN